MTIFVDASALVAMLRTEPGYERLADRMDQFARRLTSPLALWEAATALCRSYRYDPAVARYELDTFLNARRIETVAITDVEWQAAFAAYARYGKGVDPAGLNMGDCFAYACARTNKARLLYKGEDFARTDLA